MKNVFTFWLCLLFLGPMGYGQAFKIQADGKISMNGLNGQRRTSPQIRISSPSTTSNHTGLDLFNADMTLNNGIGIDFSGYNNHQGEALYASIKAVFTNRSSLSAGLSLGSSELHFFTSNMGQYASRLSIKPGAHFNSARFDFNTQVGAGLILDANVTNSLLYPKSLGGLGTDSLPWETLYVSYPYFKSSPVIFSDLRQKNSIKNVGQNSLDQLRKLRPVSYRVNMRTQAMSADEIRTYLKRERGFVDESEYQYLLREAQKQEKRDKKAADQLHFGFLAQEVEKVFPEIVDYDEEQDRYGIRYVELIPVLIEAIKTQQEEIETLKFALLARNTRISSELGPSIMEENSATKEQAILYPNDPNPFQTDTKIRYRIPSSAKSASVVLYTLNGTQIMNYPIERPGEGSIRIEGSELKAGMYIYLLLVDGRDIASYKMILTP